MEICVQGLSGMGKGKSNPLAREQQGLARAQVPQDCTKDRTSRDKEGHQKDLATKSLVPKIPGEMADRITPSLRIPTGSRTPGESGKKLRERASALTFLDSGRYETTKLKREKNRDHRACLGFSRLADSRSVNLNLKRKRNIRLTQDRGRSKSAFKLLKGLNSLRGPISHISAFLRQIGYISVIKTHFGTNLPAGRFGGRTANAPAILEDGGAQGRRRTDPGRCIQLIIGQFYCYGLVIKERHIEAVTDASRALRSEECIAVSRDDEVAVSRDRNAWSGHRGVARSGKGRFLIRVPTRGSRETRSESEHAPPQRPFSRRPPHRSNGAAGASGLSGDVGGAPTDSVGRYAAAAAPQHRAPMLYQEEPPPHSTHAAQRGAAAAAPQHRDPTLTLAAATMSRTMTLFDEKENVASNSTNDVIGSNYLGDRPSDEGFVITDSFLVVCEHDHTDLFIVQMKTMLAELHSKFGGDCETEECFPSNPLRINNQNYIEFNDDTEENRSGKNDWCHCGNCVPMPTNIESICCQEIQNAEQYMLDFSCVTLHEFFFTHSVTALKQLALKLRKTAYRSFTAWIHGYLGAGNRRPIPSCVVHKVRFAFPDDDDEYMGFKPCNDYAAEFMALE
ncbi:unnamed protein product [Ranitomeya imitator]|uniref:P2X purinoreceptor 7 intracellular domain-containing protein n=1 Tax=Ranitomeya imitator TaxID=111125 RepID=A0ABN9KXQ4_9NEOB|nr:unnamed protein product [Ranitomeya imitator]